MQLVVELLLQRLVARNLQGYQHLKMTLVRCIQEGLRAPCAQILLTSITPMVPLFQPTLGTATSTYDLGWLDCQQMTIGRRQKRALIQINEPTAVREQTHERACRSMYTGLIEVTHV